VTGRNKIQLDWEWVSEWNAGNLSLYDPPRACIERLWFDHRRHAAIDINRRQAQVRLPHFRK
jgi:hypothetical protein